jgi:uncharacterized protein YndB with AHSA1/START domain
MSIGHLTNDLRPGGMMHYEMKAANGASMWGRWIYRDVVRPERLVFVTSFSDPEGNITRAPFVDDFPLEVMSAVMFEEHDGKTTLTMQATPVNASEAERQRFEAFHESMQMGWGGTLDALAAYLAQV